MKKLSSIQRLIGIIVASSAMMANAWAAPIILNATESAAPGDTIHLQGDNFTATPQVWLHRVLATDTSLTPDTQVSDVMTYSKQLVTAVLPVNMPLGLYAVWVKDSAGVLSSPVFINRARAMQFEFAEVSPSYKFRIFGRNLFVAGSTPTVTFVNGSNSYPATVVTTYPNDSNVLQVTAPTAISAGTNYTVNVSNGLGHSSANYDVAPSEQTIQGRLGGTDPFGLNVPWGADFNNLYASEIDVTTTINPHTGYVYGSDANGIPLTTGVNGSNWVNAIQQAVYDAGNPTLHPNGARVHLPAGTYMINHTGENAQFFGTTGKTINQPTNLEIQQPSKVVIEGAGVSSTTISDASSGMSYPYNSAIDYTAGSTLTGLSNFTYTQTGTVTTTTAPPVISVIGTESFCSHVNFNFGFSTGAGCQGGGLAVGGDGCHDVLTQYVNLDHGLFSSSASLPNTNASYFDVHDCVFTHHGAFYRTRLLVGCSVTNVIYENNHATIDGQWPATTTTGNIYTGTASSGTSMTLTDSSANWTVNAYKNDYVDITSGTGLQQFGKITSNTATTLTVLYAWATIPDNTSAYTIGTVLNYTWEQGDIECDGCTYGTFLNNIFDAVNLPLYYNNDYETFNSQGQPGPPNDTGVATGGTTTTVTDSSRSWVPSTLIGQTVSITSGTGNGDKGTVTANTATTITVGTAWTTAPASGSHYSVSMNGYDFGTVTTATATTLSGTSASGNGTAWPTTGAGLTGGIVAIVNGPGMGQWRTIASNTANTLTITTPWTTNDLPTSTSTYSITGGEDQHILYKGNALSDMPRGMGLYTGSFDCAVVNNTFTNMGQCVYLRSDQRNIQHGGWSGRINLSWNDLLADNVALDTTGTWASTISSELYVTSGSAIAGSIVLNPEFRRNVIASDFANKTDNAIVLPEGYNNSDDDYNTTFPETNIGGLLGTIFDDNENVNTNSTNTNYPAYLNTASYQTSLWNELNLGYLTLTPNPYSDITLPGASHASVDTAWGGNTTFLSANFSGTGTSTGGATDMIDAGGQGTLFAGNGVDSTTIGTSSPFISGTSGDYLECSIGVGTGTTGHVVITPTTTRTSWGRIFDFRSGEWLVNGGFDFFWRPQQTPTNANSMRPFDLIGGTNGLRLVFNNYGISTLQMAVYSLTGSSGLALHGTYPGGFVGGSPYHIGVVFTTDPTSGHTTEKIFCVAGTGSFSTSSNTVGSGGLIAMSTFSLSPTQVTNTGGFLSNGPWNFGDVYGNGAANVNDYDGLNLYSQDPGTFPALGQ